MMMMHLQLIKCEYIACLHEATRDSPNDANTSCLGRAAAKVERFIERRSTGIASLSLSIRRGIGYLRSGDQISMGVIDLIGLAISHPGELRALIAYKVWRDPLNDIKTNPEESGWNRESMQICWSYLDKTSRSFSTVIKELKGEMSRVICLFYLALRALDTIEDDMTIEPSKKIELLPRFYKRMEEPGWTFSGSKYKCLHTLMRPMADFGSVTRRSKGERQDVIGGL